MSLTRVLEVLAHRWWVIVLCVAAAVGASGAHSSRQDPRYEATISVYVHPSAQLTTPAQKLNELNLLSYGSIVQTIANLGQSPEMLRRMAAQLSVGEAVVDYSTAASVQPQTTEIYFAVAGPDRATARRLADRLPEDLAQVARSSFSVVDVSPVGGPATVRKVRPSAGRDALFAALAGALVGFTLAVLTSRQSADRARSRPAPSP